MRFATIIENGRPSVALLDVRGLLPLTILDWQLDSLRAIAASGDIGRQRVSEWADRQPDGAYRAIGEVEIGPGVPDPGAIYTIGHNYRAPDDPADHRPPRPLVYGKARNAVAGDGAALSWDRSLTDNVDAEVELGVVIGAPAWRVEAGAAMEHVFGYTIVNDISSRDPSLDGDQWLLGKSMPGFCPVGPWVVTADELDPSDIRLGCTINGAAIQDGRTGQMRFSIAEVIAFVSQHARLEPGDLIATGTPARLAGPMGPERHLQPGDVATVWIENIGELTTTIA